MAGDRMRTMEICRFEDGLPVPTETGKDMVELDVVTK